MNEHWERVQKFFHRASELAPEVRDAFLETACGGDAYLEGEIRELLERAKQDNWLEQPSPLARDLAGAQIAGYEIRRLIARGGMGLVYEATQKDPERRVALKVLRQGLSSPEHLRRFQEETRVLARLEHPNVAQIFGAGVHREQAPDSRLVETPYFAMEMVEGALSVTEFARARSCPLSERILLFLDACGAIHEAHLRGIIHRDIKPANLLVGASGQLKVIDFGIARLADAGATRTRLTRTGEWIGTLTYMSPEQCEADGDVDVRSDVYALGVVLFELVCDKLPYDIPTGSPIAIARAIREEPPIRPRAIVPDLKRDLEVILLKCLEKDRHARYPSVDALAGDLRCYLDDRAITARAPTAPERVGRFLRKHKALSAMAGLLALSSALGVSATVREARRAWRAETAAVNEKRTTQDALENERAAKERYQDEVQHAEAAWTFLEESFAAVSAMEKGASYTLLEFLDETSVSLQATDFQRPITRARLSRTIGGTYTSLMKLDRARTHYEEAVAIFSTELGPDHLDTLAARHGLGVVHLEGGQWEEAERELRDVVAGCTRLGTDSNLRYSALISLAQVYSNQRNLAPALELLELACTGLARKMQQGERVGYFYVSALTNLATVHQYSGDSARALELHHQALEVEAAMPERSPFLEGLVRRDMAICLARVGRVREAEQIYCSLIDESLITFGPEHPETLILQHNLGRLYLETDRVADGVAMLEDIIRRLEDTLGEDHPIAVAALTSCALGLQQLGDPNSLQRAEGLLRDAREKQLERFGRFHAWTVGSTDHLARLLLSQGRYEEARPLFAECVDGYREIYGPEVGLARDVEQLARECEAQLAGE